MLTLHVALSVGWLGTAYAMVVIGLIALYSSDAQVRYGAYAVLHDSDRMIMIPGSHRHRERTMSRERQGRHPSSPASLGTAAPNNPGVVHPAQAIPVDALPLSPAGPALIFVRREGVTGVRLGTPNYTPCIVS
jgi:hypothetical protein